MGIFQSKRRKWSTLSGAPPFLRRSEQRLQNRTQAELWAGWRHMCEKKSGATLNDDAASFSLFFVTCSASHWWDGIYTSVRFRSRFRGRIFCFLNDFKSFLVILDLLFLLPFWTDGWPHESKLWTIHPSFRSVFVWWVKSEVGKRTSCYFVSVCCESRPKYNSCISLVARKMWTTRNLTPLKWWWWSWASEENIRDWRDCAVIYICFPYFGTDRNWPHDSKNRRSVMMIFFLPRGFFSSAKDEIIIESSRVFLSFFEASTLTF